MEFPRKEIDDLIDNSEEIQLQITDWYIPENDKMREKKSYTEEQDKYTMLIYGTTSSGITVSVNVTDYEPYFYVKGPDSWDNLSKKQYENKVNELNIKLLEDKYKCIWNKKEYYKKIIRRMLL